MKEKKERQTEEKNAQLEQLQAEYIKKREEAKVVTMQEADFDEL